MGSCLFPPRLCDLVTSPSGSTVEIRRIAPADSLERASSRPFLVHVVVAKVVRIGILGSEYSNTIPHPTLSPLPQWRSEERERRGVSGWGGSAGWHDGPG